MATRFEIYKQALLDLKRALADLDQVHASLKDVGLDRVNAGPRDLKIQEIVFQVDRLFHELGRAECPQCTHLITLHAPGCTHQIGDELASDVLIEPPGSCGCKWGLEEPASRYLSR